MDELLKWRGEFPILERSTYLISNSLRAMPRGVYDEMRAYADSWATRGIRLSPHFYNREDECDFALAQMDEILRTNAWEKHCAAGVPA